MATILNFTPKDAAKDPNHVLEAAKGEYDELMILGFNKEGHFDVRGNIGLTPERGMWLCQLFIHKLMNGDYASN